MSVNATSFLSSLLALGLGFANSLSAQCSTNWQPGDAVPGVNGVVRATMLWDPDGAGPMYEVLVVAGCFSAVADIEVAGLALLDPFTGVWSTIGSGVDGCIDSLATLANGDLAIGGDFRSVDGMPAADLAVWNGTTWTSINSSSYTYTRNIAALAALPGGGLVAGGVFTTIGGISATNVAQWDGVTWSVMGTNEFQNRDVFALRTMSNGDVVAGAEGGAHRWDGSAWAHFGQALSLFGGNATVLAFADLPSGDLLAAGQFGAMNGNLMNNLARWDGANWFAYAPSIPHFEVHALLPMPNGDLMVGGRQAFYPGAESAVGLWNGTSWAPVGNGLRSIVGAPFGTIVDLAILPTGIVLAGGTLQDSRIGATGLAAWDAVSWSPIVNGNAGTFHSAELDANGNLVVCGEFWAVGGAGARNVASWDGTTWTALNDELGQYESTDSMIRLSNGDLIVAGEFAELGGVPANGIARWDGSSWSSIGNGFSGLITTMLPLADEQFVVCGYFSVAGNVAARNVALWDGTDWKPLGSGIAGSALHSIAQLPSGEIVVGGNIGTIGGLPANGLVLWNGLDWVPFGGGTNGSVSSLKALANGDLIAAGAFTYIGGVSAYHVARWSGFTWQVLGPGIDMVALDVEQLPSGDLVFGGGVPFSTAGSGFDGNGVVRWDGTFWSEVDGGIGRVYDRVFGLEFLQGELLALGRFNVAGSSVSSGIAKLASSCPATVASVGAGCSGSVGPVVMAADGLPWIGGSFDYRASGLPANSLAIEVRGFTQISMPLLALLAQAQPGCNLLVSADFTMLHVPQAGGVEASLSLPNTVALAGVVVLQQIVPIEFGTTGNIVAVTSSNALQLTIGSF